MAGGCGTSRSGRSDAEATCADREQASCARSSRGAARCSWRTACPVQNQRKAANSDQPGRRQGRRPAALVEPRDRASRGGGSRAPPRPRTPGRSRARSGRRPSRRPARQPASSQRRALEREEAPEHERDQQPLRVDHREHDRSREQAEEHDRAAAGLLSPPDRREPLDEHRRDAPADRRDDHAGREPYEVDRTGARSRRSSSGYSGRNPSVVWSVAGRESGTRDRRAPGTTPPSQFCSCAASDVPCQNVSTSAISTYRTRRRRRTPPAASAAPPARRAAARARALGDLLCGCSRSSARMCLHPGALPERLRERVHIEDFRRRPGFGPAADGRVSSFT